MYMRRRGSSQVWPVVPCAFHLASRIPSSFVRLLGEFYLKWTPLRGGLPVGVGRADTGGNPGSVGDKFAFGNTDRRAHPPRKHGLQATLPSVRGQRAFDHTTGQGYVKSQRGHYPERSTALEQAHIASREGGALLSTSMW